MAFLPTHPLQIGGWFRVAWWSWQRYFPFAFLGLLSCTFFQPDSLHPKVWQRFKPISMPFNPNLVEFHYTFLEQPADEDWLQHRLWLEADEQIFPLDFKAKLRHHGLRVGKLRNPLSEELRQLLAEKDRKQEIRCNATHFNQVFKLYCNHVPATLFFDPQVPLPTRAHASAPLPTRKSRELEASQAFLFLSPTPAASTALQLSMMPVLQHDEAHRHFRPTPDLMQLESITEAKEHHCTELLLQVELQTGEFLLVGSWPTPSDQKHDLEAAQGPAPAGLAPTPSSDTPASSAATVGQLLFTGQRDGRPAIQVLLLRAVRPTREQLFQAGYHRDDFLLSTPTVTLPQSTTPLIESSEPDTATD